MGKGARVKMVKPELSLKEIRRIEKEVRRVCKERHLWFLENEVACMLWALHREFGFGKERLLRFHRTYKQCWEELRDYYDMGDMDAAYLAKVKLKEIGVDIDAEEETK